MRIRRLTLLLLCVALALSGCRVTGEVENQAYVLALGLDRRPDGRLELTVRVPQIGKSDAKEQGGAGSGYLLFSASGGDWAEALDTLEQATPRPLNLSHIELAVASEALAREEAFGALIARVAETPHLYTTARFVVCEGRAADFIDAQEVVIGTRLSSEIDAMLTHYAELGTIPKTTFADACCLTNSIYADPVAIRGFVDIADDQPAAAMVEPDEPVAGVVRSPMRQRYSGAALFREGQMVGWLDASQTRLLALIRGDVRALPFERDGRAYQLTPVSVHQDVQINGSNTTLSLRVRMSALDAISAEDARQLADNIRDDLNGLLRYCQSLSVDPFGFADVAAGHFLTIPDWWSFNWRERFRMSDVDISVFIDAGGN